MIFNILIRETFLAFLYSLYVLLLVITASSQNLFLLAMSVVENSEKYGSEQSYHEHDGQHRAVCDGAGLVTRHNCLLYCSPNKTD